MTTVADAKPETPPTPEADVKMTIWEHLDELRKRIIRAAIALFVSTIFCWTMRTQIFAWLAHPYERAFIARHLPGAPEFQTLGPADIFVGYLQLSLTGGVVIAIPVIFYQLWAFISPGLYSKEKRLIFPFVFFSTGLFLSGVAFAYYVAFPFTLNYFFSLLGQVNQAGTILTHKPTLELYLDFATRMLLAFGGVFELPLFISFLVLAGIVTPKQLLKFSRWAILGSFALGAVVTPGPEVSSQVAVSGALVALYFLSIAIAFILRPTPKKEPAAAGEDGKNGAGEGAMLRFTESDPRVRLWNDAPPRKSGEYVLYWCQAYRRARDNAALAYAIERANDLRLPCLFYESIRPDYPFASDRFHAFALECARDDARTCEARGIAHVFFLPRTPAEARGVLAKLAARAAIVVSDEHPGFVFPAQNAAAAKRAGCTYVTIDDATGIPMALFAKEETAARTLRPKLLKVRDAWAFQPLHDPEPRSAARVPGSLPFDPIDLAKADLAALVASCAIDHAVPPVAELAGGSTEAEARLERFVRGKLAAYAVDRNDPSRDGTTTLSPYLHWGAISARRVAIAVRDAARDRGVTESGDALLEQLLVRRGLAFNFAARSPDGASYESLPRWARATLAAHARDARPAIVSPSDLEEARSPDPLWNAAQRELLTRGVIQGYARMLWGKLVLTWTERPADAHALLVRLNDRYALDGRDPDGIANIGWCFGLHDRPWPERPVFGTVRAMTTKSARSKLDFEDYITRR